MQLLLDTHVFLWWQSAPGRIGGRPRSLIADQSNTVFVSAASVWEIAIKRRLGKLEFAKSVVDAVGANGFLELPIQGSDAEEAGALDWAHADPFDRMIVAQARIRGLTLITDDTAIRGFGGVPQLGVD